MLSDKFNEYIMMFESIVNLKHHNSSDEQACKDEFDKIRSEFTKSAGSINTNYNTIEEKQNALDEEFDLIVPAPEDMKQAEDDIKEAWSDPMEDLVYLIRQASICGTHFMLHLNQFSDLSNMQGVKVQFFRYRLAFQISTDDSYSMFASKIAFKLPEHICQFSDTLDSYSFRAYLHKGVSWDGWEISDNGELINPYEVLNR